MSAAISIHPLAPARLPDFLRFFDTDARTVRGAKSEAEQHGGPLALFLAAGFAIHREDADGFVYVRKTL